MTDETPTATAAAWLAAALKDGRPHAVNQVVAAARARDFSQTQVYTAADLIGVHTKWSGVITWTRGASSSGSASGAVADDDDEAAAAARDIAQYLPRKEKR